LAKADNSQQVPLNTVKETESVSKARKTRVTQTDVPRHSLHESLRVPQAIRDNYAKKPTKPLNIAIALELSPNSSQFRMLLGASSAYGLTEGSHSSALISLTELGIRIVAPTSEGMDNQAMREALLNPRVVREFLSKYNDSRLPTDKIAKNVLEEMGVPADSTEQTLQLIVKGAKELGLIREHKGQWYVDMENVVSTDEPADEESEEDEAPEPLHLISSTKVEGVKQDKVMSPATSQSNSRVFITHGKNLEIVNQLKELLSFGNFVPVVAAEHETVSKPVPDKVMDDMRSCYAAIIHVGKEIKLLDQEGKEHVLLNQNVLIEIGAAMALYGRRFILLVERGANLPSNLSGLYEVRYEGDKLDYDATMKLLKAFNDFKT